jgi:hypothetical protein
MHHLRVISCSLNLAVLLENISCYFALSYLNDDVETVLRCTEVKVKQSHNTRMRAMGGEAV